MSDSVIANLVPQKPILQQDKSSLLTTNPFIPNEQRTQELEEIEQEANKIIESAYLQNKTSSIKNQSLSQLNVNISTSVVGVLDDLFVKPDDVPWRHYIPVILQKEQRYTYIGILFILVAIFFLLVK